jgi:hypothetical protein
MTPVPSRRCSGSRPPPSLLSPSAREAGRADARARAARRVPRARPELLEVELLRVDVECASPLSLGQTVCDVWGDSPLPKNVRARAAHSRPRARA